MLFYIWFCLIWLYKAVEKSSWMFPLSAELIVPSSQEFKGKIQLLLGFLSNPELQILVWDRDRQKFICHLVLISVNSDVAGGDSPHCHRIMEGGTTRIIQSNSCTGHQESQHDAGAGLCSFSPFGMVSAGILPNPGNSPILWNCSCLSGWMVLMDGDRSCWNKCQLVVLIGVKLVFHYGNPGSQGDLELKTELFYC